MSSRLMSLSNVTFMPTLQNTVTMPVSWQIGRRPMADMREFTRICAMASLAALLSSRS